MTTRFDEKADELKAMRAELGQIELDVVTNTRLSDLIREGSKVSDQAYAWGNGDNACALTAAFMAAKSHDLI
jgi:hypothetical protein